MNEEQSTATGTTGIGETTIQAPDYSKDVMPRRGANSSMVQNALLVWLDNSIDERSDHCCYKIMQLRRIFNAVNTFTDRDQCIDFLTDNDTVKLFMIISGELSQHIVPLIHDVPQLDSIYIFCGNETYREQWTKEWPKIQEVFTEISSISKALDRAVKQCEHDAVGFNFMSKTSASSNTNLDQLDCSFMYTQILKEILLTIDFTQQHINEFTNYCREVFADNNFKLNSVNEFEQKYRRETPIWWYTCDSFLYPMLNQALRTMEVDIVIKMGFFIRDLHQHIEQLHTEQVGEQQSSEVLTVYRGQSLSTKDFDQMVKTKGGLMSFNNFLSTSKDQDMSLTYARKGLWNPDVVCVLFVVTTNPSESTTPFSSINDVSCFQEDEVLFSMHTVFRIGKIESMPENDRLWQVDLTLTNDNDQELRAVTDRMREESYPGSDGWYRLGVLLLHMGQLDKAQQFFEVLLRQITTDLEKADLYILLGSVKNDQGEYKEAITFYGKALEILQETLLPEHPDLATCFSNIGNAYSRMEEHSKALSCHEKGLEIRQKILPSNHPDLA